MRTLVAFNVVVAFAAAFASPLVGQSEKVWVEPRAAWIMPTRDLGRTDIIDGSGYATFEQVEQGLALGVGVGVGLGGGWGLRATVDRAFDATVEGEWKCAPFVACPAVLVPLDGELSWWSFGLDALYRPMTSLPVQPVMFAGIGLRSTTVEWSEPAADVSLPGFKFDETSAVYRFGAGIEGSLGPVTAFSQLEAAMGRFGGEEYRSIEGTVPADERTSFDLGVVAGVRVPLGRP